MTSSTGPRGYSVSDHCDGRVFFNPDGARPPGFDQVLKWKRNAHATPWPKWLTLAVPKAPPPPLAGRVVATWINHASVLLQGAGLSILIDPVFGDRCGPFGLIGPKRVHAPGLALDSLPRIDAVLVSHDHYDHCDLPTLRALSRRDHPIAVTPLGNWSLMRRAGFQRIVELDWWESQALSNAALVTATPSQHWSNRLRGRRCGRLWSGFSLVLGGQRVHFVGDTGYHPDLFKHIRERAGAPDLAFIPIGAYEPRWFMKGQHCNPAEAVEIHRDLGSRFSVAMHWGTFQLTDEGRDEPPLALAEALRTAGINPEVFRVLEPGESVTV